MSSSPVFASTPKMWTPATLTAANTALDGTGATGRALIVTAGASGALIDKIVARHKGTNIATVLRVFVNNGSDPEVAGNNSLLEEKTISANTLSQVAESTKYEIPMGYALPAGWRIYTTLGTAVAAGIHVTPCGGDI